MSDQAWERTSFSGTEQAQAAARATLSPAARMALLEDLLQIATDSGALQRSRAAKQARLDELWRAGASEASGS